MKKPLNLLEQKNIGNLWGGLKNTAQQMNMYVSGLNLVLISITAYGTVIQPWLANKGINLYLWQFLIVLVVGLAVMALLEYQLSMPSVFSFWNDQFYKHGNQMRKDIEGIKAVVDSNKKAIDTLTAEVVKLHKDTDDKT